MDEHTTHTETYSIPTHVAHFMLGGLGAVILLIPVIILMRRKYRAQGSKVTTSALTSEKHKSEIILNAIADGVMLIDTGGVVRAFNPAASKLTGWSLKEAVGLDYRSVLPLVNADGKPFTDQQNPFTRILQSHQQAKEDNAMLKTTANKTALLSLIVSPLIDQDNQFIGAVGVFRDVTAERNEEKQRAEFISTASHEMRTPVAAIEGYLALALNDKVSQIDAKARNYLEKAHTSTQALGKLFQDLLTSAKAEDGRLVSHPVATEMGSYMEQLVDSLRFAAEKKGLLVDFTIGADATATAGSKVIKPFYYAHVDPDRIREVITNLFDNAVKYTETGKITIGLTGNQEVVQLSVRDTGPGIPGTDLPHLFQKFYRVDNSATRTIGGTGLGLFICRKIVELYQGRIWAESEVGKGSTFYINLPRLSTQRATELQKAETTAISLPDSTPEPAKPASLVIPQTSAAAHDTIRAA
jgi:two-component system, OmpR family, sensor histidine kinase VicK